MKEITNLRELLLMKMVKYFVQLIFLNNHSKFYLLEQIRVTILLVIYFCTTITLYNS